MANFELRLIDLFRDKFIKAEKKTIELFTKNKDVVCIEIRDNNNTGLTIYLDKSTAIKLSKTIRTEINKMESEAYNG